MKSRLKALRIAAFKLFSIENIRNKFLPLLRETFKPGIRLWLSIYFLLSAGIMIVHLQPLPEQAPNIEFSGFFSVLICVLFGLHVLTSRSRWLLLSLIPILPYLAWFLNKKNKYLEMALEESNLLQMLPYTLIVIAAVLCFPSVYRVFDQKSWPGPAKLKFIKKGFPF